MSLQYGTPHKASIATASNSRWNSTDGSRTAFHSIRKQTANGSADNSRNAAMEKANASMPTPIRRLGNLRNITLTDGFTLPVASSQTNIDKILPML